MFGISSYLVDEGEGLAKAHELAATIAENSEVTNFAIINVLPRIADGGAEEGYLMESMIAAIAQSTDDSKERMQAFFQGRGTKVESTEVGDV